MEELFRATNPATGAELWNSDGTPAGTVVQDINPGAGYSNPSELTTSGERCSSAPMTDGAGSSCGRSPPETRHVAAATSGLIGRAGALDLRIGDHDGYQSRSIVQGPRGTCVGSAVPSIFTLSTISPGSARARPAVQADHSRPRHGSKRTA